MYYIQANECRMQCALSWVNTIFRLVLLQELETAQIICEKVNPFTRRFCLRCTVRSVILVNYGAYFDSSVGFLRITKGVHVVAKRFAMVLEACKSLD